MLSPYLSKRIAAGRRLQASLLVAMHGGQRRLPCGQRGCVQVSLSTPIQLRHLKYIEGQADLGGIQWMQRVQPGDWKLGLPNFVVSSNTRGLLELWSVCIWRVR